MESLCFYLSHQGMLPFYLILSLLIFHWIGDFLFSSLEEHAQSVDPTRTDPILEAREEIEKIPAKKEADYPIIVAHETDGKTITRLVFHCTGFPSMIRTCNLVDSEFTRNAMLQKYIRRIEGKSISQFEAHEIGSTIQLGGKGKNPFKESYGMDQITA